MNKNFIISLSLMTALLAGTVVATAETTIYTDGIGRMHFLGRDAANNTAVKSNYSNSAEQDLTRKLYESLGENGVINDTSYDQHPLKNYENTFPDSRFGTTKYWKTKYSNNIEDAGVTTKDTVKGKMTFEKGAIDASNPSAYANTNLVNTVNTTTETTKTKKHWWNRK